MGGQLDQQLGELYGTLKGMVPALERLDARQNEIERKVAAADARHEALRREFDEQRSKASLRDRELYGICHSAEVAHQANANAIEKVAESVREIKARDQGFAQKAWDVFKIILAAGAAAATTYWITRGG